MALGTIHLILIAKAAMLEWNSTERVGGGGRRPHYKGWPLEEEYHLLCCGLCEKENQQIDRNDSSYNLND